MKGQDPDLPLAVYKHTESCRPRYITSTMVTTEMRSLAKDVHGITDEEELARFSSHSLRVGACCIYFAAGYPPEFIQCVLRWESDAWCTYVRDLLCTAIKVVTAMNEADTMPVM